MATIYIASAALLNSDGIRAYDALTSGVPAATFAEAEAIIRKVFEEYDFKIDTIPWIETQSPSTVIDYNADSFVAQIDDISVMIRKFDI